MMIPEVTKVVLGELTIQIPTATPLAAALAKLDKNNDGIFSVEDVPPKDPFDEASLGTKEERFEKTVVNTFVKVGVLKTEAQKRAFIELPSLYAQAKRFNAIGTNLLNNGKSCGFFEELFYSCRSFEPKVWQSIVSEMSDNSSPLYSGGAHRVGQSFLASLLNTIWDLTAEPDQASEFDDEGKFIKHFPNSVALGKGCFEYSAMVYNIKSGNPVLQPILADISRLYSPIASALVKNIQHTNSITLKCDGDCSQFSRKSIDLVYPVELTAFDKNDVTMKYCHSDEG